MFAQIKGLLINSISVTLVIYRFISWTDSPYNTEAILEDLEAEGKQGHKVKKDLFEALLRVRFLEKWIWLIWHFLTSVSDPGYFQAMDPDPDPDKLVN